jgi:Fe-S-cluster-containing dehydrogenase component
VPDAPQPIARLDRDTASRYARTGLDNVAREYPNHPGHLLTGPHDLRPPSQLHPIFFGSYDWHSSVHQHWMLVRLLRRFPDLPEADRIAAWFDERITRDHATTEADYLRDPDRRAWERPYGWAWLMTLAAELDDWARSDAGEAEPRPEVDRARTWAVHLAPLVEVVRTRCLEWLTTARYPHRVGTHQSSAFAAMLLLDAATGTGDEELRDTAAEVALRWYGDDADYPAWVEPSGSDFLSPALAEAELLARLWPPERFAPWFRRFLPDPGPLTEPAQVTDRHDPQVVVPEKGGVEAAPEQGFRWLMASDVCKHCTEAACLEVCPTGAIFYTEYRTVVVQDDVCNGCGYCVTACPYGVIERREADGGAWKCTLCYDRMKGGKQPACAMACPTDSIQFGPLEQLRERADGRVEDLRQAGKPARLYGRDPDDGVGGNGAFFLLLDDPEVYRLPPDPVSPTRRVGEMWRTAGTAAAVLAAAVVAAFVGEAGRR